MRMFSPPKGVSAFQVVGPAGRRLLRAPTGKKARGQLEPKKGDALREVQESIRHCALLVGDERWVIGRSMTGWLEYRAPLAPFAPPPVDGVSQWGSRPVVNLLGGDLQLPPVLDAARYDKSGRCHAANRGPPRT